MNWPMSLTIFGARPPEHIELTGDSGVEQLVRVGPSMHSWVYRSHTSKAWFRLLPITEVPLYRRNAIKRWVGHPAQDGLATVEQIQPLSDLLSYYLVRYQITETVQTLGEVLTESDALARLDCVLKVVRRIEMWQEKTGGPLLLMPADVLLGADGMPVLLALPFWRLPQIEAVLAEPERSLYLAPEIVRGQAKGDGQALDRFAIGVMLLHCFRKLHAESTPGTALLRAATGTLVAAQQELALPFWMERIRATQLALKAIYALLVPDPGMRRSASWVKIALELESCRKGMDALTAVEEMRRATGGDSAFALLQDILLFQESYDLLLLGGTIAGNDLGRSLAALELLERAIALEPERQEAYRTHFDIVTGAPENQAFPSLSQVFQHNVQVANQLDAAIERDIAKLPDSQRDELEERRAEFLIRIGQSQRAVQIIYPRLFENGTYAFRKFRLNFLYAEALMKLSMLNEAEKQLDSIRNGLRFVTQEQSVAASEIRDWGSYLTELKRELLMLRNPSAFQAPPGESTT